MTLTDGSMWIVAADSARECQIKTGTHVTAEVASSNALPTVNVWGPGVTEPCELKASFHEAW